MDHGKSWHDATGENETILTPRLDDAVYRLTQFYKGLSELRRPFFVYGCKQWRGCDTVQISPPYDPDQPMKCREHKRFMTTPIEKRS